MGRGVLRESQEETSSAGHPGAPGSAIAAPYKAGKVPRVFRRHLRVQKGPTRLFLRFLVEIQNPDVHGLCIRP